MLGVSRDISARKQAERASRLKDDLLRLTGEMAHVGGWEFDADTLQGTWTDEVARIHNLDPGQATNVELGISFYLPESRQKIEHAIKEALELARPYDLELELVSATGQHKWVRTMGLPISEGSRVVKVRGIFQDITERRQTEAALRESEERYRKLLELAPIGITVHCEGKIVFINPAGMRLIGAASEEEIIGRSVLDFIHPAGLKQAQERFRRLMAGEQGIYPIEEVFLKLDGPPINVEVMGTPLSYQGKPAIQVIITDITERKRAERSIRQLNAELEQRVAERTAELSDLYNNAPCGYHSLDGNGIFTRINDTELAWLGYTREEIIGRAKISDLLTPASVQIFTKNFPILKKRGWVQDAEVDMVRKDGSILPVLLNASAVYDQAGRFLSSRSTIMDHTERRRAEVALRESQAQLEATNKELEAFAYSVSHDLRAPLRGIDGWSLALLEDYGEQFDQTARQYLDRVRSEAQRMGRLIDDLLQLSRITRTEMHRSPVDLTTLAHTVVTRFREEEPERQMEVVIQPDLTASGDAALLEIVLTNLLGNAFKFSSQRAEARVEFGCVPHPLNPSPPGRGVGGEGSVYFVRDNGAGFNMAYATKLFGAFQRMHKVSEFPGTGIGLAIVQRIIHRHSGRVWAEAEVGQGATFYFTLEEDPKGLPDL